VNSPHEAALEAAQRFSGGFSLRALALEEGARLGIDARLGDRDPVEGAVQLPVAAPVDAVAVARPGGCGQWRDARVASELGVRLKAPRAGVSAISLAAVSGPQPGSSSSSGACSRTRA